MCALCAHLVVEKAQLARQLIRPLDLNVTATTARSHSSSLEAERWRQCDAPSCVRHVSGTHLVCVRPLEHALVGVQVLELQLADLSDGVDGIVRELGRNQQLRRSHAGIKEVLWCLSTGGHAQFRSDNRQTALLAPVLLRQHPVAVKRARFRHRVAKLPRRPPVCLTAHLNQLHLLRPDVLHILQPHDGEQACVAVGT